MRKLTIIAFGLAAIAVSGCALTTAGVSPGDERNFVRSLNDVNAGRAIEARMLRAQGFSLGAVDVEVAEGIAVLTGQAPNEADRTEAERIAWSAADIVQVGNEITINDKKGLFGSAKDGILQSAIRTRLTADKAVKGRNINIETEDGVVYLLGVARSPQELERAAYIASTTKGTKEVISYIKIPEAVMQSANYVAPPEGRVMPDYSAPYSSTPRSQRDLPSGLSTAPDYGTSPQAGLNSGSDAGANSTSDTEPFYRDPKTGERIFLPPGTVTVPYNPGSSAGGEASPPHYVDPETGQQIPISYFRTRPR